MRRLTFAGFLERYVASLSETGTSGLYPLAKEAATTNPRLREPLFLYAVSIGKEEVLLAASRHYPLKDVYAPLLERYPGDSLLSALREGDPALPEEYLKVWRSYLSVSRQAERDARVKELMRQKVLKLKGEKGISTYRLCQDLRLNNANVNAWLKHGASSKVGLDTARRVLDYLQALASEKTG